MSERKPSGVPPSAPRLTSLPTGGRAAADPKTLCDRCGAARYRMHAGWRCPACGVKTACCGW